MDIARTPSTPDGNPEMADAAREPKAPLLIRREDYAPFAWLVPEIALAFELGLERTRVRSTLTVQRNAKAPAAATIRLNGDGLAPLEVVLDGQAINAWSLDGDDLIVPLAGDTHQIEIVTEIDPSANSQLMGLYASNGMLCTQCEAEGFRRIAFFPDRPDVLSTYRVRMSGQQDVFPVMLCNGNREAAGENGDGTHWAEWYDPWPKPSYLFALVAGDLVANRDSFVTMSGRAVELAIWVREGDLERTEHAMSSLKRSMKWDEETFGREYDLDTFNVVAVSDFNMGAMENKGLNIFNTKYILADPETATDGDFDAIEGVVAHEYFHNWSGNRVTCRDWFQLSLKEGFTVLRDQLFSQDMGSAPVKRIEDVRVLRAVQFPEDSGPLAHPIRPDSYREISNFYTATVYNKGAEVIRMMRTLAGPERFRAGCELYFERHDGQAATCEDFVSAIEDGADLDLGQFRLWYEQAGTPKVSVRLEHAGDTATLQLRQDVPGTPGQPDKKPVPIPLRLALFDRESGRRDGEQLFTLEQSQASLSFDGFAVPPVLSINRGFSAPVAIEREVPLDDLVFLAAHDDDPFARYEAMQDLIVGHLRDAAGGALGETERAAGREAICVALAVILADDKLDDLMRGELMILPGQSYLAEQMLVADPVAIHSEREALKSWLGVTLEAELAALHARACAVPYDLGAAARGARKLKTQALVFLAAGAPERAAAMAAEQYERADNMTDLQGSLMVLAGLHTPERSHKLLDFYNRYRSNPLVIDKWFAIQAQSLHPHVLEHVKALGHHPDFTLRNPNRVRSLYMAFTGAPAGFHAESGEGYRVIADPILALDPLNPQTAARFVPSLGRWRRTEPVRATLMRAELERIAAAPKLSRDTYEQVTRAALADGVEVIRSAVLENIPHGFLGRRGGVSRGVIAGLNVGHGAEDDSEAVAENRRRAVAAVLPGAKLATVYQVRSPHAVAVREPWPQDDRPYADAMVTDRPGVLLGVVTADCAPVLLADRDAGVVGAAHAGWRGAHAGVIENTIREMERLRARPERIAAAIGPAIAQPSYEVDARFRGNFTADDERFFAPGREGRWQFDLEGYVAARLRAAGVARVEGLGLDTYADESRFFSFRRATHRGEPNYGRQFSVIGLPG